jgi:hypothetical protein
MRLRFLKNLDLIECFVYLVVVPLVVLDQRLLVKESLLLEDLREQGTFAQPFE